MRVNMKAAIGVACASLGLAACNSAGTTAAQVQSAVPAPPPPPAPGVVGAAIGQALDEKDREIAITAQQDAVSSGARKTWRGTRGSYGFITPGAESGACRDYVHKIFIDGRPQEAKGLACRENGDWRVKS